MSICIAHSHTVRLMRWMNGVLLEQKRLESASKAVNAQFKIAKIIAEQVPCHRPSHGEGTTSGTLARRVGGGCCNGDAVVQPLERPECIAQTDNPASGHTDTCRPTLSSWVCTWLDLPHLLLLFVCVSWTITGQPRNSVIIGRVKPR